MKNIKEVLAFFWEPPVPMGAVKAQLEEGLGPRFTLRFAIDDTLKSFPMEEVIFVYDMNQVLSTRSLQIQLPGETPKKPTLEDLEKLSPTVREFDERCVATIRRNGKRSRQIIITITSNQSKNVGTLPTPSIFSLRLANMPQIVQFLQESVSSRIP